MICVQVLRNKREISEDEWRVFNHSSHSKNFLYQDSARYVFSNIMLLFTHFYSAPDWILKDEWESFLSMERELLAVDNKLAGLSAAIIAEESWKSYLTAKEIHIPSFYLYLFDVDSPYTTSLSQSLGIPTFLPSRNYY